MPSGAGTPAFFKSQQRLWILTGKGGTGRTTLAAALATLAARSGLRVLVASASGDGALAGLLEVPAEAVSRREPRELSPRLFALFIEPEESLAEYVDLQFHVGGVGKRLLANRAFGAFLDAAPGWRDLVTLGKIWNLEQQRDGGRLRFDLIVVDAPATGHGISLLSTPQVVIDAVRVGPLHRRAEQIRDLLVDARRTQCVIVTLAEELPVRETLELWASLRAIGIGVGPILVNRLEPELRFDAETTEVRIARLAPEEAPPLAAPAELAAVLRFRAQRGAQQLRWLAALQAELAARVWRVPELAEPLQGRGGVNRLADALAPSLLGAPA